MKLPLVLFAKRQEISELKPSSTSMERREKYKAVKENMEKLGWEMDDDWLLNIVTLWWTNIAMENGHL